MDHFCFVYLWRARVRRHERAATAAMGSSAHLNGLVVWKMFSPSFARIFSFAPGRLGMRRALRRAARPLPSCSAGPVLGPKVASNYGAKSTHLLRTRELATSMRPLRL